MRRHRPPLSPPDRADRLCGLALVAIVVLVFWGALRAPFFFDDQPTILENDTIRTLSWRALVPPANGSSAMGRPLVNFSLALNHAAGGLAPRGYHALNVALHAAAAALLFGIVRRVLRRAAWRERCGAGATPLALGVAAAWALHPLQTESVTVVSQRTELLAGVFVFLLLYALVRAAEEPAARRWKLLATGAAAAAMASKETAVVAPLLALLFDRTFLAGTFRAAWRERRGLHLAIAATWLLLLALVAQAGLSRGEAAGFGLGVSPWHYLLKQCEAIGRYVALVAWPHPLVLDYGTDVVRDLLRVWPQALLLTAGLGATLWALARRPWLGFFGAWFYLLLAPSSSVVPLVAQTMAEHRMYLPLLAGIVPAALALARFGRRRAWLAGAAIAVTGALAVLTVARNRLYEDELRLWQDTAAKRPQNPRALAQLGARLGERGDLVAAERVLRASLALDPRDPTPHGDLGNVFYLTGRLDAAIAQYEIGVRLRPGRWNAQAFLARLLLEAGRPAEALPHAEAALRARPDFAGAHRICGLTLVRLGRLAEARPHLERALADDPADAPVLAALAAVPAAP